MKTVPVTQPGFYPIKMIRTALLLKIYKTNEDNY